MLNWIIRSSADPAKTSLMLRGILIGLVPAIATALNLTCMMFAQVCFDTTALPEIVEGFVSMIEQVLVIVGTLMFTFGAVRKAYLGRWAAPTK